MAPSASGTHARQRTQVSISARREMKAPSAQIVEEVTLDSNYVWAIFGLLSLLIIFTVVFVGVAGRSEMIDDWEEERR
jgi:hypothetical protein